MDSRPLKALRKQTQQWQFGKQAIAFSTPTFIKQLEPTDRHEDPSVNVVKREFQNIKDYDLNYFRFEFIVFFIIYYDTQSTETAPCLIIYKL